MSERDSGSASPTDQARPLLLGVIGAGLGGVVGYFAFFAFLEHVSLYTLVIPGALIGLGRVAGSKEKSILLGGACGVAAFALSLWIEWQITPMVAGESLSDFLAKLPQKPFRNLASLVAGPFMAVWFGVGRRSLNTA